jgi:hypothetical protein
MAVAKAVGVSDAGVLVSVGFSDDEHAPTSKASTIKGSSLCRTITIFILLTPELAREPEQQDDANYL